VTDHPFAIVGIGASAGGIEALQKLFESMPADTGLAFVLMTHTAQHQASALRDILARATKIPVMHAEDGHAIKADHIYVCPPDNVLLVRDGKLVLAPIDADNRKKPIDIFLSSLAEDRGEDAVGILLSGASSDGTLGIKAVKEAGGFTLAQGGDGHGPQQSYMPGSAIAAGVVDLVVPVEHMANRLVDFTRGSRAMRRMEEEGPAPGPEADGFQQIHQILLKRAGHDFSGYKQKTFHRRVNRRMHVTQIPSLEEYVELLRQDGDEVNALFRDLLIGVTNFFRDPAAFAALETKVIPALFKNKGAGDTVRVWIPACATGEEVYSIAILLREHMDRLRSVPKVQIFASDIDERALLVARAGRYPASLVANISADRLRRFFTGDELTYAVSKEIRDLCLFSAHSVLRDPPFSRVDLISCRNLLIYFGVDFQALVVPIFHFALKPSGYLFLGTSENVSHYSDLFAPIDRQQRIFQRRDNVAMPLRQTAHSGASRLRPTGAEPGRDSGELTLDIRRAVESRVMERFAPAHVIINRDGEVLHYSARTGRFLEPAIGVPNRQLLSMARRGLRAELHASIREAMEQRRRIERRGVAVEMEGGVQITDVLVEPFGGSTEDPLYLVVFSEVGLPQDRLRGRDGPSAESAAEVQLDRELLETRERLQATIEEYETAIEELNSSNEELQSMNEELQSTNEELETSKEELQSVNEELQTINAELNAKVEEVDRANSDLRNVFDGTQIATIFLDRHFMVRSFTPAVTRIFNLIPGDRGRPLDHIVSQIDDTNLRAEVQSVIDGGPPIERPVRHQSDGTHYLMRILPYRVRRDTVDGVLITFVDVTELRDAEQHLRTLVQELNHRVRNMLTSVGAIASQTVKKTDSGEDFRKVFLARIQSMAAAYNIVSRENWGEVSLREIAEAQLEPYLPETGERVSLDGPNVMFKPAAALAFGMVVHELTTNSVKYGALSGGKGEIDLTWDTADGALVVCWTESGGPKVKVPRRRGLGSELIEREVSHVLHGRAETEFKPEGVVATLRLPLDGAVLSVAND
jgi:two-component system CheB/CheR fusion protein